MANVAAAGLTLWVEASKANDAASFYKAAFDAVEVARSSTHPIIHLNLLSIYFGDDAGIINSSASDVSETPTNNVGRLVPELKTEDVTAAIAKAVSAGAVQLGEVVEGGRFGRVKDPYGIVWAFSSPGFEPRHLIFEPY